MCVKTRSSSVASRFGTCLLWVEAGVCLGSVVHPVAGVVGVHDGGNVVVGVVLRLGRGGVWVREGTGAGEQRGIWRMEAMGRTGLCSACLAVGQWRKVSNSRAAASLPLH